MDSQFKPYKMKTILFNVSSMKIIKRESTDYQRLVQN